MFIIHVEINSVLFCDVFDINLYLFLIQNIICFIKGI